MNYWVYVHENASGDIVEDGGEFSNLDDAVDEVCSLLRVQTVNYHLSHTARVVDLDTLRTVWIAGSMDHIVLGVDLGVVDDLNTYLINERRRRRPALQCQSCGWTVQPGDVIRDTYRPDGCDHWYEPMITVAGVDID